MSQPLPVFEPFAIPQFHILDEMGDPFTQENLLGTWHVLYFYPKDLTPGCTTEANDFESLLPAFKELGCRVIGVSKDTCERHRSFREKEGLSFKLLADTDTTLCQAFGVWQQKSLYGKSYMGIDRATFLIDPRGLVVYKFPQVKVSGHAQAVLTTLKKLQASQA